MYKKIGDLMYQKENLEETIRYCKAHNAIIQNTSENELVHEFLKRVEENSGGLTSDDLNNNLATMNVAFNSFYIIDPYFPKLQTLPLEEGEKLGTHVINFFVRLGRKPV